MTRGSKQSHGNGEVHCYSSDSGSSEGDSDCHMVWVQFGTIYFMLMWKEEVTARRCVTVVIYLPCGFRTLARFSL